MKLTMFHLKVFSLPKTSPPLNVLLIVPPEFISSGKKHYIQSRDVLYEFNPVKHLELKHISELQSYISWMNLGEFHSIWAIFNPTALFDFKHMLAYATSLSEEDFKSSFVDISLTFTPINLLISLSKNIPILLCEFRHQNSEGDFRQVLLRILNQEFSLLADKCKNLSLINVNSLIKAEHTVDKDNLNLSGKKLLLNCFLESNKSLPQLTPAVNTCSVECNTAFVNDDNLLLAEEDKPLSNARCKSPYVTCKIAGQTVDALIDTGAEATLMSQEFYDYLRANSNVDFPTLPTPSLYLKGVTGVKSCRVQYQVFADIFFSDTCFQKSVLVVPNISAQFIIGIDFLTQFKAVIDCNEKSLKFFNGQLSVPWLSLDPIVTQRITCLTPITYIFADSHGRNLESLLKHKLFSDNVVVSFKPGAPFNDVIKEIEAKADTFRDIDNIVIIGGTNNLRNKYDLNEIKSQFNLEALDSIKSHVILFEIFPRHDIGEFRDLTTNLNLMFLNHFKKRPNVSVIKSQDLFVRKDFTLHGLHLNHRGKIKLVDKIVKEINQFNDLKDQFSFCQGTEIRLSENSQLNFCETLEDDPEIQDECEKPMILPGSLSEEDISVKLQSLSLTPEEKQQLCDLLYNNKDIFSDLPGCCNKFTASFRLSDNEPYIKRSYPVPASRREMVKEEIRRLLDLGIIEKSYSPYSNPLVAVVKKDETCRLCLDARTLNSKLISDAEAPEPMESLLYKFPKPNYISTLDCTASFLQIPLADDGSRDLTSFCFEGVNYQFTRLPYGTKVSMQMFIKATNKTFGPEVESFFTKYVDDFRVVSQNFTDHLKHLEIIFSKVRDAGLTLKFSKCNFLSDQVDFLGFLLTKDGIKMNPDRSLAVSDFPTPRSSNDLQSFLGFVNFYSKFSAKHANLIEPLLGLTKKGAKWHWGPREQEAFERVKSNFIDTVMLAYPDFNKPFFINTDASFVAVGGELFQYDVEDHRRPIIYCSRVLKQSERNYTITELELLAIVVCCAKFRPFILGYPTTVMTDHRALTFLSTCFLNSGRLTRWALQLQPYDLKVEYIKGSENLAADTLSRYPPELHQVPPNTLEINVRTFKNVINNSLLKSLKNLPSSQLADPRLGRIIRSIKSATHFRGETLYCLHQDLLFQNNKLKGTFRLCIPQNLEFSIIEQAHKAIGHFGARKTYNYLKTSAIFPKMEKKIRKFVSACDDCQKCKVPNRVSHLPLQPVLTSELLGLLSVDLFGPLPKSKGNFSWIFVLLDVFSKYVKLYPLRRATGVMVTRKLIENYVPDIGKPKFVLSDHGPAFISKVWHSKLKENNIIPTHTSVYHPSSNPVERYMRTLGNLVRIYCRDKHSDWISHLDFFENCINNTLNDSTGMTPVEIMKNVEPQTFLNSLIKFPENVNPPNLHLKFELLEKKLLSKAQQRKIKHDSKYEMSQFKVGDRVLVRAHHLSNASLGEAKKFFALFEGPYSISRVLKENAFEIINTDTGEKLGVHNGAHLKLYVTLK